MPQDLTKLTNEALINEFMNACAKDGVSSSGIVIDVMADYNRQESHRYKDEVLRRLNALPKTEQKS
jgi:hypothetical protein